MKHNLVFLGPPGVGKGTQAAMLAKALNIPHISTGEILRGEVKEGTPLGVKAKEYMEKGELVPDKIVVDMVKNRLSKPDAQNGYLLDGFPRTVAQAVELEKSEKLTKVLYFSAPDQILIQRLSGRRACPKCGAGYHVETMPPKKAETCDKCGEKLIQRKDDQPETIKNRLEVYKAQTSELIDHYEKAKLLAEVQSSGSVDEIYKAVEKSLR